ncbi:MAG: hypothetical protein ABSC26_02540 [Stellaceae bacterium]|jgi:hypothetical protein
MRHISALVVFVCAVIACGSARAEPFNLECRNPKHANEPDFPYLTYWVDLDRQTITYANVDNGEVSLNTLLTVPVQVSPEAFNFSILQWTVNINRLSGVNIWTGPGNQYYDCSKGARPFPAGKF